MVLEQRRLFGACSACDLRVLSCALRVTHCDIRVTCGMRVTCCGMCVARSKLLFSLAGRSSLVDRIGSNRLDRIRVLGWIELDRILDRIRVLGVDRIGSNIGSNKGFGVDRIGSNGGSNKAFGSRLCSFRCDIPQPRCRRYKS